jgi:hypothetical protein
MYRRLPVSLCMEYTHFIRYLFLLTLTSRHDRLPPSPGRALPPPTSTILLCYTHVYVISIFLTFLYLLKPRLQPHENICT